MVPRLLRGLHATRLIGGSDQKLVRSGLSGPGWVQCRHAYAPTGSDSWASLQEAPPSTLTSTRTTLPHPDHARPSSVTGPASSVLERVKNSGKPGGIISARGTIRVTGVPTSSSSCRRR